ncbi:MAG: ABC transporter permease subunit [Rubrivivax sp.]|nr:ABC transporter permease subunit [Rubrivivax sp.]
MFHGYLAAILGGLGITLGVAALSLAVACAFGLIGAVAKLSRSRSARWAAASYTSVICGLPELVLMLMLAIFDGGQILLNRLAEAQGWGYIDVLPFAAGVLTIGFIFGSYLTETFRVAILAIPKGQAEAALAFGMQRG